MLLAAVRLRLLNVPLERDEGDYRTNYSIVGIADIIGPTNTQYVWGDDILRYGKPRHNGLEVYLRRTSPFFANTNQPAKK